MSSGGTSDSEGTAPKVQINHPVFFTSAAIIFAVSLFGIIAPEFAEAVFSATQAWMLESFGWFYALCIGIFLVFSVGLAVSPLGEIKLGPDHSDPDYSYASWFAMLFSAGMGIGLLFFGVAEPMTHFAGPPQAEGGTVEAARQAVVLTLFHWGIHGWAVYTVVGLALAFFSFRHGLPLTLRSALYPIIGERIDGPIGHTVDVFSVVGTMFGIATSLGLGALQINAGVNYLFGLEESPMVQLLLIAAVTGMATLSAASGLDSGIKRLSTANIVLAVALLGFIILLGPAVFMAEALLQNVGTYFSDLIGRTFLLYAFEPTQWVNSWTLFYWAWWISWAPFVGMFIARVSRGRTIREFIVGVLLVPTAVCAVWFTAFGNTAIRLASSGFAELSEAVAENLPVALFVFLEHFPLSWLTSGLAILLITTFFVTSADSGALVIDTITSGGAQDAPVWQRVFWGVSEGVVAAGLLLAGGLTALQTATLLGALPFAVVMLFVCVGLYRGLELERARMMSTRTPRRPSSGGTAGASWRDRLSAIIAHPTREEALDYLRHVVAPALAEVKKELEGRDVHATVEEEEERVVLHVGAQEEANTFRYAVRIRRYAVPKFSIATLTEEEEDREHYYRAEVYLREGGKNYDLMGQTKDQVISDVLTQYERHLHVLELVA